MAAKPTSPAIKPDDPRVQARLAEKRAAEAQRQMAAMRAAFAMPVEVAGHTLHPPNSQTFDALVQPEVLKLSQMRVLAVLAYLLTMPPARQIAAAADVVELRNAAAVWQDSIPPEAWAAIVEQAQKAWGWINARMAGEGSFFLGLP